MAAVANAMAYNNPNSQGANMSVQIGIMGKSTFSIATSRHKQSSEGSGARSNANEIVLRSMAAPEARIVVIISQL